MGRWSIVGMSVGVSVLAGSAGAGCHAVFGVERDDGAVAAPWLDSPHAARKRLALTPPTTSALVDFPVGIVLPEDAELARAARGAADLQFTLADGVTPLAHELELFDPGTGRLVAWVRVPRLAGATALYAYYDGHDDARQPTAEPGVPGAAWAEPFAAVWHLTGASLAAELDSSAHGHALAEPVAAQQPLAVAGIAGAARSFDGDDDQLATASSAVLDAGDASLSYSLWVYTAAHLGGGYDSPLFKGGNGYTAPGYVFQLGADRWTASISDGDPVTGLRQIDLGSFADHQARWVHLAAVIDREAGEYRAYVDGVRIARMAIADLGSCASPSPLTLSPAIDRFRGVLDEVRISRGALPDAWFATEHANLAGPGFLALGAAEARP